MKHLRLLLTAALLVSTSARITADAPATTPTPLSSGVLKLVDGSLINATTVTIMQQFKGLLASIRQGVRSPSGQMMGRYRYNNSQYGSEQLKKEEAELIKNKQQDSALWKEMQTQLTRAKEDFLGVSNQFRIAMAGAKEYIAALIKESCSNRGRSDSVLVRWADSPTNQEDKLFDTDVKTFAAFDQFCVDLNNFFDDLVASCPRAQKQFVARYQERKAKWDKIKTLLPQVVTTELRGKEAALVGYIRDKHLDSLKVNDITFERMSTIITTFQELKK